MRILPFCLLLLCALPAVAQFWPLPKLNLVQFTLSTNLATVGQTVHLTCIWQDTNWPAPLWGHDWLTRIQWGDSGGYQTIAARDVSVSHTYTRPLDPFTIRVHVMDGGRGTFDMGHCFTWMAVVPTNAVVTPPAFVAQAANTNGVQLALNADPGRSYRIQASTNYLDWFTVVDQATADASGQILATDPTPAAAEGVRLYRAVFP